MFEFKRHPDIHYRTITLVNGARFVHKHNGLDSASIDSTSNIIALDIHRSLEALYKEYHGPDADMKADYEAWLNDPENADEVRALDVEAASLLGAHIKADARGDDLDVEAWVKNRPNPLD